MVTTGFQSWYKDALGNSDNLIVARTIETGVITNGNAFGDNYNFNTKTAELILKECTSDSKAIYYFTQPEHAYGVQLDVLGKYLFVNFIIPTPIVCWAKQGHIQCMSYP